MSEKKTGGLAGVVAGKTAVCTVGKEGVGLTYRGYDIHELAAGATFEEVRLSASLRRPSAGIGACGVSRSADVDAGTCRSRCAIRSDAIPANAHPMDVMRTGCSMLGALEPERT